ncbi:MAG: helix-turn-helix transcriptional regulator [Actinobacteria bacterium]|nr:helix-turn-helix transcriptional regulator [Actinomycetota bacterium]
MSAHPVPIQSASDLGEAIRVRRKSLGLRLEDVALASGTSVMFVSELERGKPNARIELALRVAASVGLSITATVPDTK